MKLATKLPKPRPLTEEDLQRIDEEATRWREAVRRGTEGLERLTGEDLAIRID